MTKSGSLNLRSGFTIEELQTAIGEHIAQTQELQQDKMKQQKYFLKHRKKTDRPIFHQLRKIGNLSRINSDKKALLKNTYSTLKN